MAERVTFYHKDGGSRSVYATDAKAYFVSPDWSTNPPGAQLSVVKPIVPPLKPKTREDRTAELREILDQDSGWRQIKAIAEPLGIEKPTGGWDEAIPEIIKKEFPV